MSHSFDVFAFWPQTSPLSPSPSIRRREFADAPSHSRRQLKPHALVFSIHIWAALLLLLALTPLTAFAKASIASVPKALRSTRFTVTIDGQPASFLNAAANYYNLNFDLSGPTRISITAPSADYWERGVEVQPWRENIRPIRTGATITFTLDHPAKLSIARPGDHLAGAEMLFLFANPPELNVPSPSAKNVRFFGPGIHRENIDAHTGDRIYLAPGAVILGALNLWDVEDVKVFGRGTILYDGPQNPHDDEGWMHKKNWHVIVMHNASRIEISGITCIVRSRTWMIQMRDSRFILFDNVKVIGGSAGNANQDGMDWLGGGDTLVRNSFIRAADDIFAMYGNWDGYTPDVISIPGHDVSRITIEGSVLSTSISNVVRLGWPKKVFNSSNFTLRDSDVIHMGSGGCGIPFALFEMWGIPDAKGTHSDFLFDDVRLEDWYSLVQIQQTSPAIHNVTFRNIWAPEAPALVGSTLLGAVDGVHFEDIKTGDRIAANLSDLKLSVSEGAAAPTIDPDHSPARASFTYSSNLAAQGHAIVFDASGSNAKTASSIKYDWFFGDGSPRTSTRTPILSHRFPDSQGTLLDGSGRFRVMLRVTDSAGRTDWTAHSVVIPTTLLPATPESAKLDAPTTPGLHYAYYEGMWPALPNFDHETPIFQAFAATFTTPPHPHPTNFGLVFDGLLRVPISGGYSFTVHSRDGSKLTIDDILVAHNPAPWPQVCGSIGNAVQPASGSIGLVAGLHRIHIEMTHTAGDDAFNVLWEGPEISLSTIPAASLLHSAPE